jgi:hypothetical protein
VWRRDRIPPPWPCESYRRRRKEKSQIWESKILSLVPMDSDRRKTTLARAKQRIQKTDSSSRQRGRPTKTRPKLSKSSKYLVMSPTWGSTPRLTEWPSVAMWLWLRRFDTEESYWVAEAQSENKRRDWVQTCSPNSYKEHLWVEVLKTLCVISTRICSSAWWWSSKSIPQSKEPISFLSLYQDTWQYYFQLLTGKQQNIKVDLSLCSIN